MLFDLSITVVLVIACVAVHVQVLLWLRGHYPNWRVRPIIKLGSIVTLLLLAHVAEVFIFAVPLHYLAHSTEYGTLEGGAGGFSDTLYFSFATYPTVGYGDITPKGNMRLLAQVEALTGLLLVGCSGALVFAMLQDFLRFKQRDDFDDKD